MSLDGIPLRIPKDINGDGPATRVLDCGGFIYESSTGMFCTCSYGHVHCKQCYCVAKRFKKGYTCQHLSVNVAKL